MMKNFNEQASPSTFISVSKGMSNEKAPKLDDFSQNQQEYYLPQNKWVQPRSSQPQERNLSTDIALSSGNNRSGLPKPGNLNTNAKLNQDYSYNNDNSRIKAKKYENSGNILEWQENIVPQNIRNQKNLNFNEKSFESNKNYEREAKKYETPKPNDYYEKNLNESKLQGQSQNRESKNKERNEQITTTNPAVSNKFQKAVPLPESRERFTKTSDQEYQNTMNTIKNIEKNLMMAQMQKEKVGNN